MILGAAAAGAPTGTFTELMDHVAQGFEALGAAILIVGVIWSFVLAAVVARRSGWSAKAYLVLRQAFGGTLLLGVEVLVAADLGRTVAVAPTLGGRAGGRDAVVSRDHANACGAGLSRPPSCSRWARLGDPI